MANPKIIKKEDDIDTLLYGDQYIFDFGWVNPEDIDLDKLNKLQEKIEKKFSTESKKENLRLSTIKDANYFAKTYPAAKIKSIAKTLGLKSTGTELSVAQLVLDKIRAEEFEKLLTV